MQDVPASDVAAIHRLVTTPEPDPEEQLREYLSLGLELLGLDAGLIARVSLGRVTVRVTAGALANVAVLRAGDDVSQDARILAVLDRQATVARLDSDGGDPAGQALGPGAVVGTPVWAAGRIVGVLAFVLAGARSTPFTPWQFGVLELLSDGVARLLEQGPSVDLRVPGESATRALLDLVPDRLYRLDDQGRLASEPTGRRLAGEAGRLADAGTDALIASGVVDAFRSSQIASMARGEVRTRVFPVVDGEGVRRYEARFVRADRDEVLCIVRDVTEQSGTEEALRESEERYRTVVESLAEGILIHDPTGRVYGCNRSATAILGAGERELLRTDGRVPGTQWVLPDGSPLGSQSYPALVTLRTGRPAVDQVLGVERAPDATRWLRVSARPLAVSVDSRLHAVTSFTDITAQRQTERSLAAQIEFEALVASISTRLIDCPPNLVDDTITGALGEVARLFDADVGFVSELSSDRTTLRLSHEWRRPGVPARHRGIDASAMSALAWTIRQFESVPHVLIRSLADLPPDAQGERAAYTASGNKAFLWVRLGGAADLAGIAGIAWKDRLPSSAEEQILSMVPVVGEAFLGALR
ncbi:MAG: PAS domain S-box protein, partial [Actinomycetota bacterium]|nr:PAS domain S-box protein [Actinomycetota bacterium]